MIWKKNAGCGILAFGVCALLEMGLYLRNMKAYNQSKHLTLGLLLFCIFMVADSIQNFTRVYRAAIRVDTLSVLAYTDSLTGLQNRTAFLEELSASQQVKNCTVTIAYGFATFSESTDKTLFDTQARADKHMYACKKAQKIAEQTPTREVER